MTTIFKYILLAFVAVSFACEDKINPELADAPAVLVVDAWINNSSQTQVIKLSRSQPYFENLLPTGLSGATVTISGNDGTTYDFDDNNDGTYSWTPQVDESFGTIGSEYTLLIDVDGEQLQATSMMGRVPVIDSVTFRYEEEGIVLPESYFGEFWARDPVGSGDTYWIKTYKNGELLNKPSEINIAFDAGFSAGGNLDGIVFIPPIRDAINPFDQDENDDFLSPYVDGDSIYIEVHSITEPAYDFLTQVRLQTDRPGGFAELFAEPLSNVSTNITSNSETAVLGFFTVSAVVGDGLRLDISTVDKEG